jgi:hypothetical protein
MTNTNATDYDTFVAEILGRYRDNRSNGETREMAIYTTAVASRTTSQFVEMLVLRAEDADD